MRKLLSLTLGMAIIGLILIGCSKDDDDDPTSYFKFAGKTYDLNKGLLSNYGEVYDATGYNLDLMLLSSSIKLVGDPTDPDVEGKGHAIYFELYSSNPTKLDLGVYVFDEDITEAPGTFSYADFVMNFNMQTDIGAQYDIMDGTLTVHSNHNNAYEITWNCIAENGETITGNYSGNIIYFDFDVYGEYGLKTYENNSVKIANFKSER